ncbi:MAG: T9SS type A sorting domain-containing protein [Chitinophagales bacterium]|nr:T9SS type A sorting domain-containing protein [Chitinophagales bacterium]
MATSLELSPNPAAGFVNIEFELDVDQPVTISFYNVEGKLISSTTESFSAGDQSIQFDISSFAAGFYFAEIVASIDKQVLKFVKQ